MSERSPERHRILVEFTDTDGGVCSACGYLPQLRRRPNTRPTAGTTWAECPNNRRKAYRSHKGTVCARCEFVPEHSSQLDVDHIDGDHENNDPTNLQTLCANCHRLKTWAPALV
jgi:5-methylcytosine-specific restriction endonuclease McrA